MQGLRKLLTFASVNTHYAFRFVGHTASNEPILFYKPLKIIHAMKKLYFLLLGLFALCGFNTAQAKLVVTDTTEFLTDLSTIHEGDSLMFFCYGESSRRAWLYNNWKADNPSPQLSRNFKVGDSDSRSYVWIINSVTDNEDGTYNITLKTLSDPAKYMTGFTIVESSKWGYWNSDNMFTEDVGEATEFTISKVGQDDLDSNIGSLPESEYTEETSPFVYILDSATEGRFNGQNDDNGDGISNFVGWNEGLNCFYEFKRATLTNFPTCNVSVQPLDQNENDVSTGSYDEELLAGDTIKARTYDHYTFTGKVVKDGEEEVTFPYVVTQEDVDNGEAYFTSYYNKDPELTFQITDENGDALTGADGNVLVENFSEYFATGVEFAVPTISALKLGYEFVSATDTETGESMIGQTVTTDHDGHVITLVYHKNNIAGLPFVPTTVTDGQFAADAHYYQMLIPENSAAAAGTSDPVYVYTNLADTTSILVDNVNFNTDLIENTVWAFTGDLDQGFHIYNKTNGATYMLYAPNANDGTEIKIGTAEEISEADVDGTASTTFMLKPNSKGGYSFVLVDVDGNTTNAAINRYSYWWNNGVQQDGFVLKFWANDAALSDNNSNITFVEPNSDELATIKFSKAQAYLNAEGAVGAWTADQLSLLKAAVAADDIAAANIAIADLVATTDTIAFDMNKTYKLTSAYKGFITAQPGVTYAMYAENDSVKWGAAAETDAYQWIFRTANDSAYYVSNLSNERTIASFRNSGVSEDYSSAVFYADAVVADTATNITTLIGERAPFMLVKSTVVPGAYRLIHNYGSSIITLCIKQGTGGSELTGGAVATNNGDTADRGNTWRLIPVADVPTGINGATVVPAGEQNSVIYDLSGRRVNNAQRGIYIISGKKVLVK